MTWSDIKDLNNSLLIANIDRNKIHVGVNFYYIGKKYVSKENLMQYVIAFAGLIISVEEGNEGKTKGLTKTDIAAEELIIKQLPLANRGSSLH